MTILPFPRSRQTFDYDCGAKAAQTVLAYYGVDMREDQVMKIGKTTKTDGTSLEGMRAIFKHAGLSCTISRLTIDKLRTWIDTGVPVILPLQAWTKKKVIQWEKEWNEGHYAVAIGYDKTHFYFEDPASLSRTYLTVTNLQKRWHDKGSNGKIYQNTV